MNGSSGRKLVIALCVLVVFLFMSTAAFSEGVDWGLPKGKPFTDYNNIKLEGAIYVPGLDIRVGPFAAGEIPHNDAKFDVWKWINLKYGGLYGHPIVWDTCETEWDATKGVECYERMRGNGPSYGASIIIPNSLPIGTALMERTPKDKVPQLLINYGFSGGQDGRYFPYFFPMNITPYDESSIEIKYIAQQLGGIDKLKGAKIAVVYHGSSYGRETIGIFENMAKKYGYELKQYEIADPGTEQTATWQQIKRWNPAYTILRGWGIMTPVAIKTAVKEGYPVEKLLGNVWSASEEVVKAAGPVAKGYAALTFIGSGRDYPIVKTLWEDLYEGKLTGKNEGKLTDKSIFGTALYNYGIHEAIVQVEAVKAIIAEFGPNVPMDGKYHRFGLENIDLTIEKIKAYGAEGMIAPLKTSCEDHTGGHWARVHRWDGGKWNPDSEFIQADSSVTLPLILERSEGYAKEHNLKARNCKDPQEGRYYDLPIPKK